MLLRQTSFRALSEPRRFRAHYGGMIGRVLCGPVRGGGARGVALTRERAGPLRRAGRRGGPTQADLHPHADRTELARTLWAEHLPGTEQELAAQGLAYFTYRATPDRPRDGNRPPAGIQDLLEQGWVRAEPIVYEDFLPRSAAGIFQSNLSGRGSKAADQEGAAYDSEWLSDAIDREVLDPFTLYEQQQNRSIGHITRELELNGTLG